MSTKKWLGVSFPADNSYTVLNVQKASVAGTIVYDSFESNRIRVKYEEYETEWFDGVVSVQAGK
jgi:hypothetical protein